MNYRKIAMALILLLCATVLLSGTLLILHAGHECHQASCPICVMLTQNTGSFWCSMVALVSAGLLSDLKYLSYASSENRFVPDWTPVRRKVKLLD